MSFQDMIAQAITPMSREGDWLAPDQRGTLCIKSLRMVAGQSGKYAMLLGKIVGVTPRTPGGTTQAVGAVVKDHCPLYGSPKKVQAKFAHLKSLIMAISGEPDDKVKAVLPAIFGDDAELVSEKASDKAKSRPTFEACGVLVDFETSSVTDAKTGKSFTRVNFSHRKAGNTPEEIVARQKELK